VTGCGPIGILTILCARHAGAGQIVATDIADRTLEIAKRMGADVVLNTGTDATALESYKADKGTFDVGFECSGHPRAVGDMISTLRPRGRMIQVGIGGADMPVPMNAVVAKEIDLGGTFRFYEEFQWAVDLLGSGRIDVGPLLSATLSFANAKEAFDLASDKSKAMKVQLSFD
jgi:L-idonate 5-dehydrogenase